jgi:hypothetical protein
MYEEDGYQVKVFFFFFLKYFGQKKNNDRSVGGFQFYVSYTNYFDISSFISKVRSVFDLQIEYGHSRILITDDVNKS